MFHTARVRCYNVTMNEVVYARVNDVVMAMKITEYKLIRNVFGHITHYAIFAESRDKISTLKSLLLAENPEKALIFTSRADQVENIASKLQFKKIQCLSLHAKTDKKARKAAIDNFRNGKCKYLVTSDLASRGLDIQNVTHIIQMDLPSNEDFFVHRSGRTARAGKTGINIVIGDEYEMRKYASIEKKFKLTVYPKMLYIGKLVNPSDIQDFE